jgi:hypothetical protein
MSTQADRSVGAILASLTPIWLWTWNGVCFGYRRGDSLFAYDGIEVGRFSGAEVYGADGSYLGEVRSTEEDGDRLITSSYKKLRMAAPFVPTIERAYKRPAERNQETLYCGYEHFPSPEILKGTILRRRSVPRSLANADPIQ